VSAVGGRGGGRSFPIYIDLILRGIPQAQQGINQVVTGLTGLQRGATGAQGPITALDRGITAVGTNSRTAAGGMTSVTTATGGMARSFQGAGSGATILNNTLAQTGVQTRAATAGIAPLSSGMSQLATASGTTGAAMSRTTAIGTALKDNIRSMIFPIGGMIGAFNEAAFMTGRVGDAQQKLGAAQAELTRLQKLGAQGTSDYADAQRDVDEATRGLNFTTRIMTQSWFDVIFFTGSLAGSATKLIERYKELSAGASALGGKMGALGGISGKLTSVFNSVTGGLTGLDGAFTRNVKSSKILANGLPPVASGINTVGKGAKGAIPSMVGMSSAATGLGAAMKGAAASMVGMAAAVGVATGALAAGIATMVVFDANVGGAQDASIAFVEALHDLTGASEETKQAALDNMAAVQQERLEFMKTIPIIGEHIAELDKSNESSSELNVALVGVADAAKVVGVAMDGSRVPVTDLAKANLDLAATAGQVLEKAGLLGAGMKILGTDMTLSGDKAIYLAEAWLAEQAASQKATQEAYNIVVAHQGVAKTMTMTNTEVIAFAAQLKALGLASTDAAAAAEEATNSYAAMKQEWAEARTELTPLLQEMDLWLVSMSGSGPAIQGMVQGLAAFNERVHGGTTELIAQAVEIALLTGGQAELNRVWALGEEGMKRYAAENAHVLEGTEETTTAATEATASIKEEAIALAELHPELATVAEVTEMTVGEQALLVSQNQGLIDSSQELGEAYFELSAAEKDRLTGLGISAERMALAAKGVITLKDSEIELLNASAKTTEAQNELTEAMADFNPSIQSVVQSWDIYNQALAGSEQAMAQVSVAGDHLQGMYDDMIGSAREFAISQVGVGEALQMTDLELLQFLVSAEDVKEAQKSLSETAQEEAERFADFWIENMEKVTENMDEWAGTMKSAFQTVGEEAGAEMEITGTEIKEKFAKGIAFTDQFWETVFPVGLADEALEKSFNLDDVIEDTRAFLEEAMDKGLVTEADVVNGFEPFLQFLEGLPADVKNSWGAVNAAMPDIMNHFRETVVGGVKFGPEIKSALHEGIVKPVIETLQKGGGFETGGPKMIQVAKKMLEMPGLDETTKAMLKVALYDPFNNFAARDMPDAVGRILAVLDTIAPGTREMVEGIDTNLSGVADIFDTNMLTPMENMRLEALYLGEAIAIAFGNTDAITYFGNEIAALVDKATLSHTEVLALSDSVNAVGTAATGSAGPMGNLASTFAQLDTNASDVARIIQEINDEIEQGDDPAEDLSEKQLEVAKALGLIDENGDAVPGKIDAITAAMNGGIEPTKTMVSESNTLQENLALINGTAVPAGEGLNIFERAVADSQEETDLLNERLNTSEQRLAGTTSGLGLGGAAAVQFGTDIGTATEKIGGLTEAQWMDETKILAKFDPLYSALEIVKYDLENTYKNSFNTAFANLITGLNVAAIAPGFGEIGTFIAQWFVATNTQIINGAGTWMISWINHFTALNAYIPLQLGLTVQLFGQYMPLVNTAVILELGKVMVSWLNHFLALNATIPIQLGLAVQLFGQYMVHVNTAVILGLGNVMLSWVNHFTALNAYVTATFPAIIGLFNTWVGAAATQVLTQTTQMSIHWASHASSVSGSVNTIAGHMTTLQGITQSTRQMVLTQTTQMSVHWNSHQQSLRSQVGLMAGHLGRLANAVNSNMSKIVSAMNRAASAANNLRAAINRLQNKTITVTTRFRTVGTPVRAAKGFSGLVQHPTRFLAGEEGPEFVHVQPMKTSPASGLASRSMLAGGAGMTIRAANGASALVGVGDDNNKELKDINRKLQYIIDKSRLKDKPILDITLFEDFSARVTYEGGETQGGFRHNFPGPFTSGDKLIRGRTNVEGRFPATFTGPKAVPGNLPNPRTPTKGNWLHEDLVAAWANSYGYRLKDYDPISDDRLKFRLTPSTADYKYIWEDIAAAFLQNNRWKFVTGGYDVTGSGKSAGHTLDMMVQHAAKGMHKTVKIPTMILAGEKGPERVDITPGGTDKRVSRKLLHQLAATGGGGGTTTGGSNMNIDALVAAIVSASARHPIQLFIDGRQVTNVVRARINEGYDSMR
jgi:hypothetical protein